jgi:hypothetical protein
MEIFMPTLTGQCLCGEVSFRAEGEITMMGNCHCTDCQQVSGSAYATPIFMNEENVNIQGEVKSFSHKVDSGNTLIKEFCPTCGSQMFGKNAARPGSLALKAGSINEKDYIKPQFNVFASRKLECVTLDDSIPAFETMPG